MTPVVSSNVRAIDHDGTDLFVEFNSGAKYKYFLVPPEYFQDMLESESVGRYLNTKVKKSFEYEKIN